MHVALLPRLSIGNAALDNLVVSTIDLGSAAGRLRLDGILGYPFFAGAMVQLDFAHRVMRFGPPGSFAPAGDRIALDTDREVPEAVFRINGSIDAPFIVDTGNSSGTACSTRRSSTPTPASPPRPAGDEQLRGHRRRRPLVPHAPGIAAARVDALLGQNADVIVAKNGAFADRVDAGNVGLAVLRKFTVTFDLANHALYLGKPGV